MKHLLDVNVLLAAIWGNHPQNAIADAWLTGKSVVVCPLSEWGFLRISTNKKAINAPMSEARTLLEKFLSETKAARISDDLPALDSKPQTSDQVTDHYLADLAAAHELKFATFDAGIAHAAVELVR
jgi:hypothetical protein